MHGESAMPKLLEVLHAEGKNISQIAKAYNISVESLLKYAKLAGVDLTHRKIKCCRCHKKFETEVDNYNIPFNKICPNCNKKSLNKEWIVRTKIKRLESGLE
jgi:Zn finger protein HypA/HybF involved in hydrogenase expression